jgi:ABC-2 type transport system permease protein
MEKLWLVICSEFKQIAKTKTYIFVIIAAPVLLAGILLFLNFMPNLFPVSQTKIGIICKNKTTVKNLTEEFKAADILVDDSGQSREILDTMVIDENIDGYLLLPKNLSTASSIEYVNKDMLNVLNTTIIKQTIEKYITNEKMKQQGLSPEAISNLTTFPDFISSKLSASGEKSEVNMETMLGVTMGLTGILFALIMVCGQFIARSIMSEKRENTVEIILSSISPSTLQFGKIIGICGAFILQYLIWILMAVTGLVVFIPKMDLSVLPDLPISLFIYIFIFFIFGLLVFIAIFAGIGSIATDEKKLGQMLTPAILIAIIPLIAGQFIISNPSSTLNVLLSLFPLTSSATMPIRIFAGSVPFWQILLSIIILIFSVIFLFIISAKIFKAGILMTGKEFKLKNIKQWLRI